MVFVPERGFGWNRKGYIAAESTYGTPVMPLSAYSVAALEFEINPAKERLQRDDTTGLRSFQNNRFTGRQSADWRIMKYIVPNGSLGTAPDDDVLLQGAMGDKLVTTNTVQYSIDDDDLQSISMYKHIGHFMQGAYGCAVNQLVISLSGSDFSTFEFSGPGKDYVWAGTTTISAAANRGVTNIVVADRDFYSANIIVQVGDETNGSTGYKILSVSSNGTLVISPTLGGTVAQGGTITPYAPTMSTAGDALHGIAGSFTTNSTAITIISATVTINNNLQLRDDEYGQTTPTAIILDRRREVTFQVELYLTRAQSYLFGEGDRFLAQNIDLIAGTASAKRLQVDMAQGEFDIPNITDPGSEGEMTLSASGAALSTSSGQDDVVLSFI